MGGGITKSLLTSKREETILKSQIENPICMISHLLERHETHQCSFGPKSISAEQGNLAVATVLNIKVGARVRKNPNWDSTWDQFEDYHPPSIGSGSVIGWVDQSGQFNGNFELTDSVSQFANVLWDGDDHSLPYPIGWSNAYWLAVEIGSHSEMSGSPADKSQPPGQVVKNIQNGLIFDVKQGYLVAGNDIATGKTREEARAIIQWESVNRLRSKYISLSRGEMEGEWVQLHSEDTRYFHKGVTIMKKRETSSLGYGGMYTNAYHNMNHQTVGLQEYEKGSLLDYCWRLEHALPRMGSIDQRLSAHAITRLRKLCKRD
jgi:hypothetical protein